MNLQDCYNRMEADYDGAMECLLTEARIYKFYSMFQKASYLTDIENSIKEKDYQNAFLHVHNLKGVCLSLGFSKLHEASSDLCEALRDGKVTIDITPMYENVKDKYQIVLDTYLLLDK